MNKCTNCGHEFEGNFCPNCGAKYEGEHIGAIEADVSQPVQPVQPAQPAAQHTQAPKIVKKLYAHMPKLISVLFAVFAVLMLICFAGGVQKSDLGEEFGGTPESVYSYISSSDASAEEELEEEFSAFAAAEDDEDIFGEDSDATLKNVCAALVAFGVIAVVFAAFGLAVAFWVPLSAVKFHIGDRTLKLPHIVNIISYTLVFVIFLLGCILCANAGDELGLAEPGAAPICIIFFSLLFGLLMVAALFGRKIISYIWGGVKQEYEDELKERRVGLVAPVAPDVVAKPQKPKKPKKPDYKEAAVADSEEEKKKIVKHIKRRETVAYLAMIIVTAFVGSIIAIIHYAKTKTEDFWKVCKQGSIKIANIVAFVMMSGFTVGLAMIIVYCIANPYIFFNSSLEKYNMYAYWNWHDDMGEDMLYISEGGGGCISWCELEKGEAPVNKDFEYEYDLNVKHLGYFECKKISKMSNEEFCDYILQRKNLWNYMATFSAEEIDKNGDCYVLDGLLYIASADGLENVVQGYEKNAKPIIDAINALNEYFELDMNESNFHALYNYVLGEPDVDYNYDENGDENGVAIRLYDSSNDIDIDETRIISEEQYAELESKLQAVPHVIKNAEKYLASPLIGNVVRRMSFMDPELSVKEAILKLVDDTATWGRVAATKQASAAVERSLILVAFCVGIAYFLVMWILTFRLLITSRRYTKQLLGAKSIRKTAIYKEYLLKQKAQKQQYEEQLKEYKAYRKAYFGYLVELGYFEEGVPHVAKKQKA